MVFSKYVEVGRVAFINYGSLAGKLVVIVDILNTSRVLVDGPTTGVRRQEISISRLQLVEHVVNIPRGVKRQALKKAVEEFGLEKKFGESAWGRRLATRAKRRQLSDFDRFKVKVLKQKRRLLVNKSLKK
jgi:large subunit ribosomal protein L14e